MVWILNIHAFSPDKTVMTCSSYLLVSLSSSLQRMFELRNERNWSILEADLLVKLGILTDFLEKRNIFIKFLQGNKTNIFQYF